MRCPDCNKFVGLEFQDPQVDSVEIQDGLVTVEVSLERNCADCGNTLKTANLQMEADVNDSIKAHEEEEKSKGKEHDYDAEEDSTEQIEEGGGRYAKSYFGAKVDVKITCSCGGDVDIVSVEDKVAASEMEENV